MVPAVTALGTYLPENRVGNDFFEARLETTEEWIVSRTGITERCFAGARELTSDLADKAVEDLEDSYGRGIDKVPSRGIDKVLVIGAEVMSRGSTSMSAAPASSLAMVRAQ